jgi:hypothetical protein
MADCGTYHESRAHFSPEEFLRVGPPINDYE